MRLVGTSKYVWYTSTQTEGNNSLSYPEFVATCDVVGVESLRDQHMTLPGLITDL